MSLVQNPFSRRGYLLSVSDIEVRTTSSLLRFNAWGSYGKRVFAALILAAFALFTVGSGFLMATSNAPKASADPFSDIFCVGLDKANDVFTGNDVQGYYGDTVGAGNSTNYVQILGQSLLTGRAAGDGTLPIKQPGDSAIANKQQTAYEKYTPFLPEFDFWYGAYVASDQKANITMRYVISKGDSVDGKEHVITGSLSKADSDDARVKAGETVGQSKLFFHDAGSCIGGKFGGTAAVLGANTLFAVPQILTFFSAEIYGWAYQNSAISDENNALHGLLYGTKDKPNSGLSSLITGYPGHPGLKDVLYLPFLIPIIMLAALSLAWTGLVKRQSIAAAQAAIWMAAASIIGLLLLWHPTWVPGAADFVVSKVDDATMSALNSDNETQALCKLNVTDQQKSDPSVIARELKCTMWYNTIYVPWVSGQFGTSAEPDKNSVLVQRAGMSENVLNNEKIVLGSGSSKKVITNGKTYGPYVVNWATFQLENQNMVVNQYASAAQVQKGQLRASMVAWSQLSGAGTAKINTTWGGDAIRQGNAAILAAVASLGTLLLVLTSAIMLIAYQISVIFLVVLSPFFFLLGAIPGFGRRIMIRWFELILSTVVKRVVLTLLVAVFLRLYSMIMQLDMNWWLQVVLITIIAVVALLQRGKIVSLFVDAIDFGGDKRIGDGTEGMKSLGGKLLGAAAGAAVGRIGAKAGLGGKIAGAYAGVGGDGDGGTGLTGTGDSRRSDAVAAAADATDPEAPITAGGDGDRAIDARDRDADNDNAVPRTTAEQVQDQIKAIGEEPKLSDFEGDEIEQEAQYQAAMEDYNERKAEYVAEHGEIGTVSKREQKRAEAARKAIIGDEKRANRAAAKELDPITAAQLKANKKAKREGMFTGMARGWDSVSVDARGNLKFNTREFGRIYQGAKKDAKSTELNALLALDQAEERRRGVDTHNLLTRQVELQERMLTGGMGGTMPVMPNVRPAIDGGSGTGGLPEGINPSGGPVGGFDADGNPTWQMVEPQTPPTPASPTAPYSAVDTSGAVAGSAGTPAGIEEGAVIVERPQYAEPTQPNSGPGISGGSAGNTAGSAPGVLDRTAQNGQAQTAATPRTSNPISPVKRVAIPQVNPARNVPATPVSPRVTIQPTPTSGNPAGLSGLGVPVAQQRTQQAFDQPVATPPRTAPATPKITAQPSVTPASPAGLSGFGAPVSQERAQQAFDRPVAQQPAPAPAAPALDYNGTSGTVQDMPFQQGNLPEQPKTGFLGAPVSDAAGVSGLSGSGMSSAQAAQAFDAYASEPRQSSGQSILPPAKENPDPKKMTPQERQAAVQNRVQEIKTEKQAAAERTAARKEQQAQEAAQKQQQIASERARIESSQAEAKAMQAQAEREQGIARGLRGSQTFEGKTSEQWEAQARKSRQLANANTQQNRESVKKFNESNQGSAERIAQSKIPLKPFPGAGTAKYDADEDRTTFQAQSKAGQKIDQGRRTVKGRVEKVQDAGAAARETASAAKSKVTGGVADRLKSPVDAIKNQAADLKATRDEAKDKFGRRK